MDFNPRDYHCVIIDSSGVPEADVALLADSDSTAVVTGCELSRNFPDYSCLEIRHRGRLLYAQWGDGQLLERLPPRA